MIEFVKKRVEELGNKIFGLGIMLTPGGVEIEHS
jgi:hypothetical protein